MFRKLYLSLVLCGVGFAVPFTSGTPPTNIVEDYKKDICHRKDYWIPAFEKTPYAHHPEAQLYECQFIMEIKRYKCYSELLNAPECIGEILKHFSAINQMDNN
jgi:hypothetical protein